MASSSYIMKILMIARSNLYTSPGGDTVQIDMTAQYLRRLGVDVHILTNHTNKINKNDYNIIHFFNIIRPDDILPYIKNLKIPFVVSTIFVDYSEYESRNRKGLLGKVLKKLSPGQIEYIKAIARWIKNGEPIKSPAYFFRGHKASVRKIAKKAAIVLPNSESEYKRFSHYIGFNVPHRKIVNAIDKESFYLDVEADKKYLNHILCVGRIEGRKNQLNLIKALMGLDVQLTIIGKPSPNHINYYNECRRLADQCHNVHFINHVSHSELAAIYKAAKVHVLPSWFETTGLSSLEAGVMGCNIVVTDKGDVKEYFGNMAYYCNPDDVSSIRHAILEAYKNEVNPVLQNYILEKYTWENAAQQTLDAYKQLITT